MGKSEILYMLKNAKKATRFMACLPEKIKNTILVKMAVCLNRNKKIIIRANDKDMAAAEKKKKSSAFLDRLKLDRKRIQSMSESLTEISKLEDPVGSVEEVTKRPNGLVINKVRVPIGVIGIIYESRPDVTSDCIGLCMKSGNVSVLRGGSDSLNTNESIFGLLHPIAKKDGFIEGCFNVVRSRKRKDVDYMLKADKFIDLIIPRGGQSLIREVSSKSKIPVLKHYQGICHVYVDEFADLDMAERIALNAKLQRPGVCNAMETLLVHKKIAARFIPSVFKKLILAGVRIKGCGMSRKIAKNFRIEKATSKDYKTEYLDLVLNVKVVNNLEEAIAHIGNFGSAHSDSIVTDSYDSALRFLNEVDSSGVFLNASTRFTDGRQFGKGAEIGISTGRLHARGPVGLKELTTYKYVVFGNGQIRQ